MGAVDAIACVSWICGERRRAIWTTYACASSTAPKMLRALETSAMTRLRVYGDRGRPELVKLLLPGQTAKAWLNHESKKEVCRERVF